VTNGSIEPRVGRVDIVENRLVGMKSRGLYETPGGTILLEALRSLRSVTMDRNTLRLVDRLSNDYAELVYAGRWFGPEREAMDALFRQACTPVSGEVTVRLFKGSAVAERIASPHSLYSEDLATFGHSAAYAHADAEGFIKLYGLPLRVAGVRARRPAR
jgi:argininosuccinate synthase